MNVKVVQDELLNILKDVTSLCEENGIEYWLDAGTLLGAIRHEGFIPWDDDIDIGMDRKNYEKFLKIAQQKLPNKYFIQTPYTDNEYKTPHVPCKIRNTETVIIEDNYDIEPNEKGLYIDIFPFDYFSENKLKRSFESMPKTLISLKMLSNAKIKKPVFSSRYIKKNIIKMVSRIFKIWPVKANLYISKMFYKNVMEKNRIISYGVDTCYFTKFNYKDIFPLQKVKFSGVEFWAPRDYNEYLKKSYGNYMELPSIEERQNHISYFRYKNK